MTDLRNLTHEELSQLLAGWGEPRYRAGQVFRWLHARGVATLDAMTDVSLPLRARLANEARPTTLRVDAVQQSHDGTRKLRLALFDGLAVEAVLIPDGAKLTLCVSSQVGCALGCTFCATAAMGLRRHLSAGEIVDQIYRAGSLLGDGERVTNLVFMGMGEPFHNYDPLVRALGILMHPEGQAISPRRITVSTAGMVPAIERYGGEPKRANLAVSLNATTDEVRNEIMPINRRWPIARLLAAIRRYPLEPRRRVTFEYVLLSGVNDSESDARRLPTLLQGIPCKVNLIPYNPHPDSEHLRPARRAVETFQETLRRGGLPVYVRTPRGDDIDAACGQLAARSDAPGEGLVSLG